MGIAKPVLREMTRKMHWTAKREKSKGIIELTNQVKEGTCSLWEDEFGVCLRIVRMVVLELQRNDGFVCVQVAEWKGGNLELAIALPSTKLRVHRARLNVFSVRILVHSNLV